MSKKLAGQPHWGYTWSLNEFQMHTVVESSEFIHQIEQHLDEDQIRELINYIAMYALEGDLIKGAGGARKIRCAKSGRGKSSGIRVIYYYHNEYMPIMLFTAYAKNERANLTKAECNVLKTIIKKLVATFLEN